MLFRSKKMDAVLKQLPHATKAERKKIHQEAYELRLALEKHNFKYHYVQAAQTVAMAASVGEQGILGEPAGVSSDLSWVRLHLAADAYESTVIYKDVNPHHDGPTRRDAHKLIQATAQKVLFNHLKH